MKEVVEKGSITDEQGNNLELHGKEDSQLEEQMTNVTRSNAVKTSVNDVNRVDAVKDYHDLKEPTQNQICDSSNQDQLYQQHLNAAASGDHGSASGGYRSTSGDHCPASGGHHSCKHQQKRKMNVDKSNVIPTKNTSVQNSCNSNCNNSDSPLSDCFNSLQIGDPSCSANESSVPKTPANCSENTIWSMTRSYTESKRKYADIDTRTKRYSYTSSEIPSDDDAENRFLRSTTAIPKPTKLKIQPEEQCSCQRDSGIDCDDGSVVPQSTENDGCQAPVRICKLCGRTNISISGPKCDNSESCCNDDTSRVCGVQCYEKCRESRCTFCCYCYGVEFHSDSRKFCNISAGDSTDKCLENDVKADGDNVVQDNNCSNCWTNCGVHGFHLRSYSFDKLLQRSKDDLKTLLLIQKKQVQVVSEELVVRLQERHELTEQVEMRKIAIEQLVNRLHTANVDC